MSAMLRFTAGALLGLAVAAFGCGGGSSHAGSGAPAYPLVGKEGVYTLVNLHPDEAAKPPRLYSTNYQHDGLIPRCTAVRIDEVTPKVAKFTVLETGRKYEYYFKYEHITDSQSVHLDKVFGPVCDSVKVARMSDIDQKGIKEGKALPGMTKEAVLLAMGYPPQHKTPTLDGDKWWYWRRTVGGPFAVVFVNGKVERLDF